MRGTEHAEFLANVAKAEKNIRELQTLLSNAKAAAEGLYWSTSRAAPQSRLDNYRATLRELLRTQEDPSVVSKLHSLASAIEDVYWQGYAAGMGSNDS